jgi:uncharacterized protein
LRAITKSYNNVTLEDNRDSSNDEYGEVRFVTLGFLRNVLVQIVTAEIDDDIRIISLRKADRYEQKIYDENIGR